MRMITMKEKIQFQDAITKAINELSLEQTVDMPDHVIAHYIVSNFEFFNLAAMHISEQQEKVVLK